MPLKDKHYGRHWNVTYPSLTVQLKLAGSGYFGYIYMREKTWLMLKALHLEPLMSLRFFTQTTKPPIKLILAETTVFISALGVARLTMHHANATDILCDRVVPIHVFEYLLFKNESHNAMPYVRLASCIIFVFIFRFL